MAIFMTSMSGSESLTFFTDCFFHFSRSLGFRMAFDVAESNGIFSCIQCQRSKESSSRGKRQVFLCRRTAKVKVIGKVIPASFVRIERWGRSLERKTRERERDS